MDERGNISPVSKSTNSNPMRDPPFLISWDTTPPQEIPSLRSISASFKQNVVFPMPGRPVKYHCINELPFSRVQNLPNESNKKNKGRGKKLLLIFHSFN